MKKILVSFLLLTLVLVFSNPSYGKENAIPITEFNKDTVSVANVLNVVISTNAISVNEYTFVNKEIILKKNDSLPIIYVDLPLSVAWCDSETNNIYNKTSISSVARIISKINIYNDEFKVKCIRNQC